MTTAAKAAAEIVSILGSESCNLVNALIKTRILASQIGQDQLNEWVGWELNGYPDGAEVPDYRRIKLTLKANAANAAYRYNGYQLPTMQLSEENKSRLLFSNVRAGVAAISTWIGKSVVVSYPPEFGAYFRKVIDSSYSIESLWGEAGVGAYEQILVEIRSRLLGYVLDLQKTLPQDDINIQAEPTSMKDKRDSMFQGAIFGHGTTIQIGNSNVANVTNHVVQGDLSSLIENLRGAGVAQEDLKALEVAVELDGDEPQRSKKLGPAVAGWVGGIIGKAAAGAWDVTVSAAGSLVGGALSTYYGIPLG